MSPKRVKSRAELNLVADAARLIGVEERQGRRLAEQGAFGRLRKISKAEALKHRLPPNTRVVVDMGKVQQLKAKRLKVAMARATARKMRRRGGR